MFRNNRPLKVLNRCSAIRCSLRSSMFNPLAHQSDVVFTHQPVNPPNLDIVDRFKTVEEGAKSRIPTQLWGGGGGGGFKQRRCAGDMFCLSICTCCTCFHTHLSVVGFSAWESGHCAQGSVFILHLLCIPSLLFLLLPLSAFSLSPSVLLNMSNVSEAAPVLCAEI